MARPVPFGPRAQDSGDIQHSVQRVCDGALASFTDFAHKRAALTPTFTRRAARDAWGALAVLQMLSVLPIGSFGAKGKRFLFLPGRHDELARLASGDDSAIIGKGTDLSLALPRHLPYLFSGDLYAAAHAVLFGRRGVPHRRIIARWIRFFRQQAAPCYLVVPNDTSPISLLLAKIADECANMRVVCVQHGLFNEGFDDDAIEGRNSDINLVYDQAQSDEMCRRLPGAVVEVMGFPADLARVERANPKAPRVVLVGTGMVEHPDLYRRSMEVFAAVAAQLSGAGWPLEYRPHPAEQDNEAMRGLGLAINRASKKDLLTGERHLFIGFTSTLLYEASLYGHPVVILDDPIVPGYWIRNFGTRVDAQDLTGLRSLVAELFRSESADAVDRSPLADRFKAAIARAEARLAR